MIGRVGVRSICASFFGGGSVSGLNSVFKGEPRRVPANAYLASGQVQAYSGAVGWPYIEAQHDKRIAWAGGPHPSGQNNKMVIYEVAFSIRFHSTRPKGEDALDDHDAIIDAFTILLRSDRTLGTANNQPGSVLWQAGEGDSNMGDDIHVVTGPGPKQRKEGGPIIIWSMVRFLAVEIV